MNKTLLIALLLAAATAANVYAAEYVVKKTGDDTTGTGSEGNPWLTIGKLSSTMTAADTGTVYPGLYNERVSVTTSGTDGNYITYKGVGGWGLTNGVICRGFDISASYVRVIGFEITHNSTTYARGLTIGAGGGERHHVEFLYNYIHDTFSGPAIRINDGGSSNIVVRGNTIYWSGKFLDSGSEVEGGISTWDADDHHWLVEYNTLQRCSDFMNLAGNHHIARNNYMFDYDDSYVVSPGTIGHVDGFQQGSDGVAQGVNFQVLEANMIGDNVEIDSHIFQFRDTVADGDGDFLIRGNVGYNYGSYGLQSGAFDRMVLYNNTFHELCSAYSETPFGFNAEGGDPSEDNYFFNNIMSTINGGAGTLISVGGGSAVTAANNLGFDTASHASLVSTADPLFTSIGSKQFWVQASSPAIGVGGPATTITSATGSGTSFTVANPGALFDGWGIANGDTITVEAGTTVTITGISGSTVTVSASVSWTQNDDVYIGTDTDPDLGAYPYGHTPLTSATYTAAGVVTPVGDTRCVRQFRNGLEIAVDYTSPYSFSHTAGDVYRAFALYASATPIVLATDATPTGTWNITTLNVGTLNVGQ